MITAINGMESKMKIQKIRSNGLRRGFTLAELIGVICLIGFVAIVLFAVICVCVILGKAAFH